MYDTPQLYKCLNLTCSASYSDIRTAYLRYTKFCHPDKCKSLKLVEQLLLVQQAYSILGDALLRRFYDANGWNNMKIAEFIRWNHFPHHLDFDSPAHFNSVFDDFQQRVNVAKRLLHEWKAFDTSNTSSGFRASFLWPGWNPANALVNSSCSYFYWICRNISISQNVRFRFLRNRIYGQFKYQLSRHLSKADALDMSKENVIASKPLHSILPGLLWFNFFFSLSPSLSSIVTLINQSQEPHLSCQVSIKKAFTPQSFLLLGSTLNTQQSNIWKPRPHLEYIFSFGPNITGHLQTSLSSTHSNVTALFEVDRLAYVEKLSGCLDINQSEFVVQGHCLSYSFTGTHKAKPQHIFPLPGIELYPLDSAQVDLRSAYGSSSGTHFILSYKVPLSLIDPFASLDYVLKWYPTYGFFFLELRLTRLSAKLELPIALAYPLNYELDPNLISPNANWNWLKRWIALLTAVSLPIFLHRLWVALLPQVTPYSFSLRSSCCHGKLNYLKWWPDIKLFNRLSALCEDKKSKEKITIKLGDVPLLKKINSWLVMSTSRIRYTLESLQVVFLKSVNTFLRRHGLCVGPLLSFLQVNQQTQTSNTFWIETALYGYRQALEESKHDIPELCNQPTSVQSLLCTFALFRHPQIFSRLGFYETRVIDVTSSLQAAAGRYCLVIPKRSSYATLPGFISLRTRRWGELNDNPILYVKYRFRDKILSRFFSDGERIQLP